MGKLECKLIVKTCPKQGIQSLSNCYMCENLVVIDDTLPPGEAAIEDPFKYAGEKVQDIPEKALRYNGGKPKWSYINYKSLEPMIRVLEFGALKYTPFNWQKAMSLQEILESMQRHLAALFDGEEVDSESGISHMGHIMCNAMFYNYHKNKQNEIK